MAEKDDLRDDDRSAADIRQDLAAQRQSISHTVDALNRRLHESLQWRRFVRDKPLAAVGVAAGAGLLLSTFLLRRRRSPAQRITDAIADSFEDLTDTLREALMRWPAAPERKRTAAGVVTAALASMAGRAALDMVKRKAEATMSHRATPNGGARRTASAVSGDAEAVS